MNKKETLPNGYTYLAVALGEFVSWAYATDPVTAIQKVERISGLKKTPIYVIYGKGDEIGSTDAGYGYYGWDIDNPPTPIGIYTVTERSIKPLKKGDFKSKPEFSYLNGCEEWITKQMAYIESRKNFRPIIDSKARTSPF